MTDQTQGVDPKTIRHNAFSENLGSDYIAVDAVGNILGRASSLDGIKRSAPTAAAYFTGSDLKSNRHPLDHDEDGRKGGSKAGAESTAAKGAANRDLDPENRTGDGQSGVAGPATPPEGVKGNKRAEEQSLEYLNHQGHGEIVGQTHTLGDNGSPADTLGDDNDVGGPVPAVPVQGKATTPQPDVKADPSARFGSKAGKK